MRNEKPKRNRFRLFIFVYRGETKTEKKNYPANNFVSSLRYHQHHNTNEDDDDIVVVVV